MKRYNKHLLQLLLLLVVWLLPSLADAQFQSFNQRQGGNSNNARANSNRQSSSSSDDEDPCVDLKDDRRSWTIDPLTGIAHEQEPDTSYLRLADRQTMEGMALSISYTGNHFSPHLIEDYFKRRDDHDFLFLNAYSLFAHRPEDVLFRSTKVPYTVVGYTTSGSNLQSNDRLRIDFAGNVNKQIGLGTNLDYVYARGDYMSSATKPLKWTSYAYYQGEQYKAFLTYNLSKLANQENGGITDRSYVLNPDKYDDNFTDPKTMPTQLANTWNDMDSWNIHLTHSYDLGTWNETYPDPKDSSKVEEHFTSVASIFHSVDFESYKHMFRMEANGDRTPQRNYFGDGPGTFLQDGSTQDSISYSNFSTYAGLRINEGFSSWSQFGLAAFIGFEHQSYNMMQDSDTLNANFVPYIPARHTSDNVWVGGQLSRHQSSNLTFDVTGKLGISGDKAGDIDITGKAQTVIPFGKKDSLIVNASGYFRNTTPSYMMTRYLGNHIRWNNEKNFKQEQRLRIQGEVSYPRTGTVIRAGFEHIKHYHYFAIDSLGKFHLPDYSPRQLSDRLDIFSVELSQDLHWRALHWNNSVLFQKSTVEHALALPEISVRSDLNLRFLIAKTLWTELGAIAHYRTKYMAPTYLPATQQFATQQEIECGGYPTVNAYVNCNLKRIKFYIMYSGIGTKAFSNNAFIMPFYPAQPTRLEYGVIFDLQN